MNAAGQGLSEEEREELSSLSRHADWCDRVHCRCPLTSVLAAAARIKADAYAAGLAAREAHTNTHDAAPAPTDNQHNNELADLSTAMYASVEWADLIDGKWKHDPHSLCAHLAVVALRAVVDGPTTPTQKEPTLTERTDR